MTWIAISACIISVVAGVADYDRVQMVSLFIYAFAGGALAEREMRRRANERLLKRARLLP